VIRPKHVLAIVRYTWSGAWRRWVVFVPPALLVLLLLFQLPRVVHVASLFDEPGESWRAIAGFAELVEAVYANCLVLGTIFALALGASSTGRRGVRRQIAPILARPLSRLDFALGRIVGHAMVLAVFWLIPAVAFEALRVAVGSPVRLHPLAYLLPYALHLLVMAGGMAAGSMLRAIPAALVGMAFFWIVLFLRGGHESPGGIWQGSATASRWLFPPLTDLLHAAAPFMSPATLLTHGVLLVQAAAWVGIFFVVTAWRYERADFGSRSP